MRKKFKFTRPTVEAIKPIDKDIKVWDSIVQGFGLKVTPSGKRVYILFYRINRKMRWYTIGEHGSPWTPDTARDEALRLLGEVVAKRDPALSKKADKQTINVSELCDLYLKHGCNTKKESTIYVDTGRIERHIKPLIGKKCVTEVTKVDIERFLNDLANGKTKADVKTGSKGRAIVLGGKGAATRTVGLLGGIFSFAVDRGLRLDNPVRGVKRFADKRIMRFLSQDEWAALGKAIKDISKTNNTIAVDVIRLLALTGCRKSEILTLKWQDVDLEKGYLYLSDSKTGQKIVPIGTAAIEVLLNIIKIEDNEYVFPGIKAGEHLAGVPRIWEKIKDSAGLNDLRLHDLRHSFASVGANNGMGLQVIGAILGHKDTATTQRYAHLSDDPVRNAVDKIANKIANAMG